MDACAAAATPALVVLAIVGIPLFLYVAVLVGVVAFAKKVPGGMGPPVRNPTHPSGGYQPISHTGNVGTPPRNP